MIELSALGLSRWETTQTDQPGRVEIQLPPDEQAEASAAGADESWQLRLVLVSLGTVQTSCAC